MNDHMTEYIQVSDDGKILNGDFKDYNLVSFVSSSSNVIIQLSKHKGSRLSKEHFVFPTARILELILNNAKNL